MRVDYCFTVKQKKARDESERESVSASVERANTETWQQKLDKVLIGSAEVRKCSEVAATKQQVTTTSNNNQQQQQATTTCNNI